MEKNKMFLKVWDASSIPINWDIKEVIKAWLAGDYHLQSCFIIMYPEMGEEWDYEITFNKGEIVEIN